MHKKDAQAILKRYKEGTCTDEEKAIVENWILYGYPDNYRYNEDEVNEDLSELSQKLPLVKSEIRIHQFRRRLAAASVILLFCFSGLFFYYKKGKDQQLTGKSRAVDTLIKPGGNNAILTLADGKKIILNNASEGEIAKQSGISITKTADGQLIYNAVSNGTANAELLYNTIETPKGGQYQIILPDGTKVWLNAASSLRFPAVFTGNERKVELTGEGYFEVAKNKKMPFRVASGSQVVEVLGTHFNINSYHDEAGIKTTLLEGSVRIVSDANKDLLLKPGQQALLHNNSINVKAADMDEAVAWKNGLFQFNNTDLKTVMRQLSRWYDVSVRYEGTVPDEKFGGAIERSLQLSEVFEILEKSKVRFRIEGREVIVMP